VGLVFDVLPLLICVFFFFFFFDKKNNISFDSMLVYIRMKSNVHVQSKTSEA